MKRFVQTSSLIMISAMLFASVEAAARTERIRWTHPDEASVGFFRVHVGPSSGAYNQQFDVYSPSVDPEGAFFVDLEIPDNDTVYVAMTAHADGLSSFYSNERVREPDAGGTDPGTGGTDPGTGGTDPGTGGTDPGTGGTDPGTGGTDPGTGGTDPGTGGTDPGTGGTDPGTGGTDPGTGGTDPGTGGASAAIDRFVLWDADSDTVIDRDFRSGEMISLALHPCTAIEVIGNAYLAEFNSAGSVHFTFDGDDWNGCTQAGLSHENEPPFAWEGESGRGLFDCAETLTAIGSHTLVVTPFDGDDCTGTAGPEAEIVFDVVSTDEPLGRPGRPAIVLP